MHRHYKCLKIFEALKDRVRLSTVLLPGFLLNRLSNCHSGFSRVDYITHSKFRNVRPPLEAENSRTRAETEKFVFRLTEGIPQRQEIKCDSPLLRYRSQF